MTMIDVSPAANPASTGPDATGSRNLRGYLAEPDGAGPFPAVLMIHEAFGLSGNLRRQADRLARAGYLTLAVDLYSDGGMHRCLVSTMRSLVSGTGKAVTDLSDAQGWLERSGRTNGNIGVIGFCMGGGFALLIAKDGFDAAAVNYGRLPDNPNEALLGACPVVGNFGKADRTLPGTAAKLEAVLSELGIEHDIKEFDGAGHAFMNDTESGPRLLRPLFHVMGIKPDPAAAEEAWQRIEEYFARHLAQPK